MINVNQMTAAFAKMPDAALKQYAMMHKNDPYTMSLAMSESNRRKQIRDSAQGQAAQQPTVVDQGIDQMDAPPPQMAQALPENVGIGTLPQQPMQMAEGGIVAFDEGGGVMDRIRAANAAQRERTEGLFGRSLTEEGRELQRAQLKELLGLQQPVTPDALAAQSAMQAGGGRGTMQNDPRLAPGFTPTQAPVAPPADKGGIGDLGAPRPTAPPRATPAAQAGLGDLATTYSDILKKQDFKDPAEARLGALEKKEQAAAEEKKAAILRDQAKFDDAYKGREKRLSDRESDIGKQKDTNTGLAFLNAGLAIMSTPGGLATAIGKGAQVGTAQFAAGLDKIRSAQERLDDARDKMEDLKLNRAEMSAKDVRAAEEAIRNVGIDAEKRGIDGLRMAADVNRKTAADMFKATVDVGVNRERMTSAEGIAALQEKGQGARSAAQIAATLNTPDRLVFDKLLKDNNNDAVAAATELQKMKTEKFNVYDAYSKYLQAFAGKDTLKGPDDFEVFAKRFIPTVTPGKNTTVRTQPGG